MKKATFTIGLFTVVTALTSFATPTTSASKIVDNIEITSIDGSGSQSAGGNKKVDFNSNSQSVLTNQIAYIDGSGSQSAGGNKKVD
jgi:hypothetical protein